ncbi:hypothetical protein FC093_04140 [Ilyomonas limi]|jgi:hypothetical protein|uniref:Uncharacterized protein n=1 Tax=Ilyomonas limi TaxID=2575867 RepID=A0A4U3L794_9BACT|nr:hypothetical protein [Ilyomonas limi]TKK70892.1 hypothetical protein FC093_04140 [Ilyomonas limi]
MENNQKNDKPTTDAMKGYNPTDRDFQRTPEETDRIDQSEIDANQEEANKNTERANTKPEKDKMNN